MDRIKGCTWRQLHGELEEGTKAEIDGRSWDF
jgi:hypothetical protein